MFDVCAPTGTEAHGEICDFRYSFLGLRRAPSHVVKLCIRGRMPALTDKQLLTDATTGLPPSGHYWDYPFDSIDYGNPHSSGISSYMDSE